MTTYNLTWTIKNYSTNQFCHTDETLDKQTKSNFTERIFGRLTHGTETVRAII